MAFFSLEQCSDLTRSIWAYQNACGSFLINRPALALSMRAISLTQGEPSQIWEILKRKSRQFNLVTLDNTLYQDNAKQRDELIYFISWNSKARDNFFFGAIFLDSMSLCDVCMLEGTLINRLIGYTGDRSVACIFLLTVEDILITTKHLVYWLAAVATTTRYNLVLMDCTQKT